MFAFFAIVAWLIGNVAANFAALDKTFSLRFLWELPAGYDINQTLIDYTNQDSHLRAAFVGLLNTGVVAVVGIFLATALGFSIGILRLSITGSSRGWPMYMSSSRATRRFCC